MYLSQMDIDMSRARTGIVDAAVAPSAPRAASTVCLSIMFAFLDVSAMDDEEE